MRTFRIADLVLSKIRHGSVTRLASNIDTRRTPPTTCNRTLRCITTDNIANGVSSSVVTKPKSDRESFEEVFPKLVTCLTEKSFSHGEIQDALQWFKQVCEYNVPFGKKNRGLTVVHSYKCLVPEPTENDLELARILGWCVEWLQAFFLVADDVMDDSITRRGKPCWFRQPGVNLKALNDCLYLENSIYQLLKMYFRDKSYYVNLIELFHQTTMQTIIGQCLDLNTASVGCVDFEHYTLERYHAIVKWKTAFYSFYLPVALSMYMAGITDAKSHDNAKDILLRMGTYFQVQDDYLDCFSDAAVTGKVGTDIEDNKCSWLVVQALCRCNDKQRQILQENYGQKDITKVNKVKQLYEELQLPELYHQYEEESYRELMSLINMLSGDLPQQLFTAYVNKIFKRQK